MERKHNPRFFVICSVIVCSTLLSWLFIACGEGNQGGSTTNCIGLVNNCPSNQSSNSSATNNTNSATIATPQSAQPTQASSNQPTTAPKPTQPAQPASGTTLCNPNWSSGLSGWNGSPDWKVLNGSLINDGTHDGGIREPTLISSCSLATMNYSLKATVNVQSQGSDPGFGFFVRYTGTKGYMAGATDLHNGSFADHIVSFQFGIGDGYQWNSPMRTTLFNPSGTHTYEIQAKDNNYTILIDGGVVFTVTDNAILTAGNVGLWDKNVQLTITGLTVTAL